MDNKQIIFFNSASSLDLIGGSQRSIDYLLSNLFFNRKIFFICWNFSNDKISIIKLKKFTLLRIPHPKKNLIQFIRSYIKLAKIYKMIQKKDSIIWSHSPLPFFFFKWLNNKNHKYFYSVHGPLLTEINYYREKKVNNYFLNSIYKYITKDASKIIFNSFYTLKTSLNESNFLHDENLIVKELLVDEKLFLKEINLCKKKYKKKDYNNGNFFIIPRRLVKRTGVKIFITELVKKKINNNVRFYITGEGDDFHDIQKICSSTKNLIFLGKINQNLLSYLIYISKGIVIPSIEAEGYCIVAKEARLLNKFVLHTNQGGLKESLAGYPNQKIFKLGSLSTSFFKNLKRKIFLNKNKVQFEKNKSFNLKFLNLLNDN